MKNLTSIDQLLKIMERLRDPNAGCPWDLQQDFSSIAQHTIEEAYEVTDAIARGHMDDLRDELGDLLFQSVFHAQLASELGAFDFEDVVKSICDKMIRRHPHIFADAMIANPEDQAAAWENQKAKERDEKGVKGVLAGIPNTLPANLKALKLQQRAARVGFDWPELQSVFEKLEEELTELKSCINEDEGQTRIEEELGDILFVCINLCRKLNVNPDAALNQTNMKFLKRFKYIEQKLSDLGKTPDQSTLDEMDALWNQSKINE